MPYADHRQFCKHSEKSQMPQGICTAILYCSCDFCSENVEKTQQRFATRQSCDSLANSKTVVKLSHIAITIATCIIPKTAAQNLMLYVDLSVMVLYGRT